MTLKLTSITNKIGSFFVLLLVIFGAWLSLFDQENLRVLVYTLLLYGLICLIWTKKYHWFEKYYVHLISLICIYMILQILIRCSPLIQLKEFEWTHPSWQRVAQVNIIESESYKPSRKAGYVAMNIIYEYRYQQRDFVTEQSDVARQYELLLWDTSTSMRSLIANKFQQNYDSQQYVVLLNPAQPEESIYFYSQAWFDLRGSWISIYLHIAQLLLGLLPIILFGIGMKKIINPNNVVQRWSKPKRYLFIAVFFIVSWTLLMACWILYMYLTNS